MKEDLKKICNYSDKQMSHPTAQLMYVDAFSSEDEEYKRMVKRQNRELVVDAILDDKVEELNLFKENQVTGFFGSTLCLSTKGLKLINLLKNKYKTFEDLLKEKSMITDCYLNEIICTKEPKKTKDKIKVIKVVNKKNIIIND